MLLPSRPSCQEHWALRGQTQDREALPLRPVAELLWDGVRAGAAEGEREQLRGLIILGPPLAEPTGQPEGRGPDEPGVRVDPSADKGGWTRGD